MGSRMLEELEDVYPNTLWELLDMAIEDTLANLKNPLVKVDMNAWHDPGGMWDVRCSQCLAGGVLHRCGVSLNEDPIQTGTFGPIWDKMKAINCMRMFEVPIAYKILYDVGLADAIIACKGLSDLWKPSEVCRDETQFVIDDPQVEELPESWYLAITTLRDALKALQL